MRIAGSQMHTNIYLAELSFAALLGLQKLQDNFISNTGKVILNYLTQIRSNLTSLQIDQLSRTFQRAAGRFPHINIALFRF